MGYYETIELTSDQTVIHAAALWTTIIAGLLMQVLPRRWVFLPFLFAAIFIPLQQRIVIGGFDFFMVRILILFGFIRVFTRSEWRQFEFNAIDKIIIAYIFFKIITFTILHASGGAFINRLGAAFDTAGNYFLLRCLIRDFEDFVAIAKGLVFLCIPLATAMIIEWTSGRNFFSIFGGVPETTFMRDGRFRCQGAFLHPILAGTFGASLFPIFIAFWRSEYMSKLWVLIGATASFFIVATSSSSGPALTFLAGIGALSFWPIRAYMRHVRWGIVGMMIVMQIAMKAPIWALINRVKVFGSSTAYHRFWLFDQFVKRFREWFLLGTPSTMHWGMGMFDITNQYVKEGVNGGILTVIMFVAMIVYSFKYMGFAYNAVWFLPSQSIFYWSLGASLFSHVVSFWGVSYFDQILVLWYFLIAMISSSVKVAFETYNMHAAELESEEAEVPVPI
jgi:hypothetical protein